MLDWLTLNEQAIHAENINTRSKNPSGRKVDASPKSVQSFLSRTLFNERRDTIYESMIVLHKAAGSGTPPVPIAAALLMIVLRWYCGMSGVIRKSQNEA